MMLRRKLLSVSALAVLFVPTGLSGQSDRSVLAFLEPRGTIGMGGDVSSALSSADYRTVDDALLEVWEIQGTPGERWFIDMISVDFDAYLYLSGPGMLETVSDDDSAGNCNARIAFSPLERGTYRIAASSVSPMSTGTYLLRLSDSEGTTEPGGCEGNIFGDDFFGEMGMGSEATAEDIAALGQGREVATLRPTASMLTSASPMIEGRPAEVWTLEIPGELAGEERVAVIMRSDAFDPYLYFMSSDGTLVTDDDSGDGVNAVAELPIVPGATYTIAAASLGGNTGPYTVEITPVWDVWVLLEATLDEMQANPGDYPEFFDSPPWSELDFSVTETDDFDQALVRDDELGEYRNVIPVAFAGQAGETVTLETVATDFDPYFYVYGPGTTLRDDDSGGSMNPRISFTLPENGTYIVGIASYGAGGVGAGTIRITR